MEDSASPADSGIPPSMAEPSLPAAHPWGFWATFGFLLLIALGALGSQLALGAAIFIVTLARGGRALDPSWFDQGWFEALGSLSLLPALVGLSLLFAYLRRGLTVREYLGLKTVSARGCFRWSLVVLVLVAASDLISWLAGRPIVPDVMITAYRTAGFLPLLWLALVVAAPLSEEFLFRGFLFAGWSHSPLGWRGATVLISLLWTVLHLQYGLYEWAQIFVGGLALGWARRRSGSVLVPMMMHSLMNLIATVETAIFAARLTAAP
jgi:membrane protease YdiL (CAAX protease family)